MRPARTPTSPSAPQLLGPVSPGRALILLPILLALFALALQLSSKPSGRTTLHLSEEMHLLSEQEYLPHPRRAQARRTLPQQQEQQQLALPLPMQPAAARRAEGMAGLGADWQPQGPSASGPKIAFCVTTSESLAQIRVWLAYHRAIGVSVFYLFVDGQAARPEVMSELRRLEGVKVIPKDEDLKKAHSTSRIWNETWLSAFFHKPCNHELFVVQSLNMELAIRLARRDKVDWLLHIDTDELIYPSGSRAFSLQEILAAVPAGVDTLVFPNYESLPEREDVSDPFTEVTLFKKNFQHVVSDLYFKNYHTVARGNPNYFITYGNGKSAARVQKGLRPNGAHRWHSYVKNPREETSEEAAVLHYTYNRFGDLKSRRDRCDCAPTEDDAKRCFILPFDRMAFLEASLKPDGELLQWFRDRLVWGEPGVVTDLLKKGLFARLYEPQIMIQGFLAAQAAGVEQVGQQQQAQQRQQGQQQQAQQQQPENIPGQEAAAGGAAGGSAQQGQSAGGGGRGGGGSGMSDAERAQLLAMQQQLQQQQQQQTIAAQR